MRAQITSMVVRLVVRLAKTLESSVTQIGPREGKLAFKKGSRKDTRVGLRGDTSK